MNSKKALIQLNIGILFLSTSGVLGRHVTVDSTLTNLARAAMALLILAAYCYYQKISLKLDNRKDLYIVLLSGVLFGGHWVTYFYALDYSNVAIALLSLYTYVGFTAILEPLMLRTPINRFDIMLSLIVFVGVLIMAPSFDVNNSYTIGILFGLLSSVFYTFRNILISVPAKRYDGSSLMVIQLAAMVAVMMPFMGFYDYTGLTDQWFWILLLALFTTALGHTLFVKSFKELTPTTSSILSCVVPVYGILWAFLILGEVPTLKTMIGGAVILSVVLLKTLRTSKSS
jgi:drug/metabolite transporter (DMT)-like permease